MPTDRVFVQCPKCPNYLTSSFPELNDGDVITCPFCNSPIKIKVTHGNTTGIAFDETENIIGE
jgi:Zn finger protein HypA/HybF involved in hydrogenase expression